MMKMFHALLLSFVLLSGSAYAGVEASGTLDMDTSMTRLGEVISRNLEPATCLGVPVSIGDLVLLPVISKAFGFGIGGGLNQQGETTNHAKDAREMSKDHTGLMCGAGGMARVVAVILIRKDGTFQIHRMEENFLVQMARHVAPVVHELINKAIEFRMLRMQKGGEDHSAPPPPPQK